MLAPATAVRLSFPPGWDVHNAGRRQVLGWVGWGTSECVAGLGHEPKDPHR